MAKASSANNWHYNKKLAKRAKTLRTNMTHGEIHLWKHALSGKKMLGYSFNRQRPVGKFIVDFMCKELMIVIEVDGHSHTQPIIIRKDAVKDQVLREMGFTVLRFRDDIIFSDLGSVIAFIEESVLRICDMNL